MLLLSVNIWKVCLQKPIHFSHFEIIAIELLKFKENNKKICNTFDHNFSFINI